MIKKRNKQLRRAGRTLAERPGTKRANAGEGPSDTKPEPVPSTPPVAAPVTEVKLIPLSTFVHGPTPGQGMGDIFKNFRGHYTAPISAGDRLIGTELNSVSELVSSEEVLALSSTGSLSQDMGLPGIKVDKQQTKVTIMENVNSKPGSLNPGKMMGCKPVFVAPGKTVINFKSGFGHKLLCDNLT